MILGGGTGNLINRIAIGSIVDFMTFLYKGYSFFIFNIADIFITLGIIFVILGLINKKNRNEKYFNFYL